MARMTIGLLAGIAVILPAPALAQFGSLFGGRKKSDVAARTNAKPCDKTAPKSAGSQIMGNIFGGIARRTVGRTGVGNFVPIPAVSGMLTDFIACKLDAREQKQAADATATALRSGTVGSSSTWASETRADVSGTSTVTALASSTDGSSCMSVNDVIIVAGEETTVSKRMCRAPGASGYTLAA